MKRAALALLIACAPDEAEEARAAFGALHGALYRVEEAPDDDALWALLASALHGEALTRAYVEARVARARMAREGQQVRVLGVDYGDVLAEEPDTLGRPRVDATWWVRGVVRHGDHSHARINAYRASYTLAELPQGWRIVDTQLRDLERVRSAADVLQEGGTTPSAGGYMDPLELLQGLTP